MLRRYREIADKWIAQLVGRTGWVPLVLLGIVALTLGAVVHRHGLNFAAGADESGYLHNVRLIREGRLYTEVRPIADLPKSELRRRYYQPLGLQTSEDRERQAPMYAFGFPVLVAAVETVTGVEPDTALQWALMLIAMAAPLLVYALARELELDPGWALVAAAAVAASPMTVFMAQRPMSDLWSLDLACVAAFAGLRSARSWGWGATLGVAVSWALLTRVTNVLLLPMIVVAVMRYRRLPRHWWGIPLAALPGCLVLMWLNQELYGSPWRTGYVRVTALFNAEHFWPTLRHYGWWIWVLVGPALVGGFLLLPTMIKRWPWRVALVGSWVVVVTGFYCFYSFSSQTWWYTRFLLPVFPAITLGGAWVWQRWARRSGDAAGVLIVIVVLLGSLVWSWRWNQKIVPFWDPSQDSYVLMEQWLTARSEPADLFVCGQTSGSLYYQMPNPILRFEDLRTVDWKVVVESARRAGIDVYAVLFRHEAEDQAVLIEKIPGEWEPVASLSDVRIFKLQPAG